MIFENKTNLKSDRLNTVGPTLVFLFYSQGGNELRELPQQLVNIPSLTGKFKNKPATG